MNTRLLKMGRRHSDGCWRWSVPGFGNGIVYIPHSTGRGPMAWGSTLKWPARDDKGEMIRGVDLGRHRALALREVRALLSSV